MKRYSIVGGKQVIVSRERGIQTVSVGGHVVSKKPAKDLDYQPALQGYKNVISGERQQQQVQQALARGEMVHGSGSITISGNVPPPTRNVSYGYTAESNNPIARVYGKLTGQGNAISRQVNVVTGTSQDTSKEMKTNVSNTLSAYPQLSYGKEVPTPINFVSEIKKPREFFFGDTGKRYVAIGVPGVVSLTGSNLQSYMSSRTGVTGFPSRVGSLFVPTTPSDIVFYGTTGGITKVASPVMKKVIFGGFAAMGGYTMLTGKTPEEKVAGGIVLGGSALGIGSVERFRTQKNLESNFIISKIGENKYFEFVKKGKSEATSVSNIFNIKKSTFIEEPGRAFAVVEYGKKGNIKQQKFDIPRRDIESFKDILIKSGPKEESRSLLIKSGSGKIKRGESFNIKEVLFVKSSQVGAVTKGIPEETALGLRRTNIYKGGKVIKTTFEKTEPMVEVVGSKFQRGGIEKSFKGDLGLKIEPFGKGSYDVMKADLITTEYKRVGVKTKGPKITSSIGLMQIESEGASFIKELSFKPQKSKSVFKELKKGKFEKASYGEDKGVIDVFNFKKKKGLLDDSLWKTYKYSPERGQTIQRQKVILGLDRAKRYVPIGNIPSPKSSIKLSFKPSNTSSVPTLTTGVSSSQFLNSVSDSGLRSHLYPKEIGVPSQPQYYEEETYSRQQPGNVNFGKVEIRSFSNVTSRPLTKPVTFMQTKPISRPMSTPIMKPISQPISKPISQPIIKPISKPMTRIISTPITKVVTRTITRPITRITTTTITGIPTNIPNIFTLPKKKKKQSKSSTTSGSSRFSEIYTPSVGALLFNIKGKRPTKLSYRTGGFRPLPV